MLKMNKKQKRSAIKELALLTDKIDWESDSEIVARVEVLGNLLSSDDISESSPLPELDFEKLTSDNYLYLKYLGYTNDSIRKACRTYRAKFDKWIKENELTRNVITTDDLAEWEFNESSKKLPLKGAKKMAVITKEKSITSKTTLLLNESEKTCIMLGKGFMKIDFQEKDVSISLDHLEATDISEKKEHAVKIAEEYGGQIVKIQTRTILSEVE
ncbi:hypothetical protein IW492_02860 [Enterococcus sp. BWB1-3]|uniref:hypothetical protein n=1 Tax=Enterococcus sp. BWB1-3 TaxID=2787713 RepID=UPI001923B3B5|nr:hypothetical protein [Enterococcus sp. BWB1-3]MBL1228172.1 hypothetical protein [Enterococcus sp. BWB1-3]